MVSLYLRVERDRKEKREEKRKKVAERSSYFQKKVPSREEKKGREE